MDLIEPSTIGVVNSLDFREAGGTFVYLSERVAVDRDKVKDEGALLITSKLRLYP